MKFLTLSLFVICMVLFPFIFSGCASVPPTTKFDGKWEFCKNDAGETRACLKKEDVGKLREILIRCKQQCGEQ